MTNHQNQNPCQTGLVLSGGAMRGFAHCGIIQALIDHDIVPDMVSGVSSGALMAVLYGAGIQPTKIFEIARNEELLKKLNLRFPNKGLYELDGLLDFFMKYIKVERIEELNLPVFIGATNWTTGDIRYFNEGPLLPALKASMTVPLIFKPVEIDGDYYFDGGLVSNLPVEPLEGKCQKIIGAHLNPPDNQKELPGYMDMLMKTILTGIRANSKGDYTKCDLFIEPPELIRYSMTDKKHLQEMYDAGYNHTVKMLDKTETN